MTKHKQHVTHEHKETIDSPHLLRGREAIFDHGGLPKGSQLDPGLLQISCGRVLGQDSELRGSTEAIDAFNVTNIEAKCTGDCFM